MVAWTSHRSAAGEAAEATHAGPFSPRIWEACEGCRWRPSALPGLRVSEHYISGPAPGQDRAAWLEAMREYRRRARDGELDQVLECDFRGVRAWTRLAVPVAMALDLQPGDELGVRIEARRLEGQGGLCIAFDLHGREGGTKLGWTEVQAALEVPEGREWRAVETVVRVPSFDAERVWLRPIAGMDATRDPRPGRVEVRRIELQLAAGARDSAALSAARSLGGGGLDRRLYDAPGLAWAARAFTCHFTFLYDRSFYDPVAGRYTLDAFLDEGLRELGGYDLLLLWQGYPRLGVDPRNQFDTYRDLPGGLDGLRGLARRAHDRGVRVSVDYNPWDQGTRREGKGDEEALASLVAAIDADGIFLDTMTAGSRTLRSAVDAARPGVAFAPEGHPEIEQLSISSASWAQGLDDPEPPGILKLKWIEPRHMQYQIRRWDRSHRGEIEAAFFNGSGMLVWENVFGAYNPWPAGDRKLWRRAAAILRHFARHVASDAWDPHYPTLEMGLFANRWPGGDSTLFTLVNRGKPLRDAPLLDAPAASGSRCYDVWRGERIETEARDGLARISGSVNGLGAIAVVDGAAPEGFEELLALGRREEAAPPPAEDARAVLRPVAEPEPVARTLPAPRHRPPPGMVFVPGGKVRVKVDHQRRECGCYPDPGTPPGRWPGFLWGTPHDGSVAHDYTVEARAFFIDEAEVSNSDFRRFLEATGHQPKHPERFLAHWPGGRMPDEIREHPVVFVDLGDARAYARWARKRLPAEAEWHLAAQGTDGRAWPWGNELDPARCNPGGSGTMPVRSLPEGRSPYGCYHMSGNVWEWTESFRDDGHTRFAIVRGGSWFDAKGSIWYVRGGPRPCTHHAKLLLLWTGLDRSATIGFRCAADVEE